MRFLRLKERISAHRFMLASRSLVFKTQLFGPMAEAKMDCIKINEMKDEVLNAVLHFIYTDQIVNDASSAHDSFS
jgi:speckle-type POZ protein